jgi:xylulokinase
MLFIGVDLGTSAVKLLLADGAGYIKRSVSEEYPIEFPRSGWSQQDPDDWWKAVLKGIPELLRGFDAADVCAMGCAGQMHGLVALDDHDEVIRPAILWNDGRTGEQVDYLNEVIGKERLISLTANIAYAGFTAPKILWMRENEPELFGRIRKIMLPKDFINYRLTGSFVTDCSDASGTLLFDVQNRCWSEEMLHVCHVRASQLPEIHESDDPIGKLTPSVAEKIGLPTGVVVCAGAGDNAAAAIGCGVIGDGRCNISLGTSGTIFLSSSRFNVLRGSELHSFAHADGGFSLMGCILSAASCNKWWIEKIMGSSDIASEQAGINPDEVAEEQTFFLPYLMGERSPLNDSSARAAFVGMSMATGRTEMTRSILEGVSFAFKDCLNIARDQGISIESSMVCGGGAKSAVWLQMLANVLGITLLIPKTEQGPGYGGAMLGMVASGMYSSVAECAEHLVVVRDEIKPHIIAQEGYERRYEIWRHLYPSIKNIFTMMAR